MFFTAQAGLWRRSVAKGIYGNMLAPPKRFWTLLDLFISIRGRHHTRSRRPWLTPPRWRFGWKVYRWYGQPFFSTLINVSETFSLLLGLVENVRHKLSVWPVSVFVVLLSRVVSLSMVLTWGRRKKDTLAPHTEVEQLGLSFTALHFIFQPKSVS